MNFNRFGIMLDCSRNAVMNINTLKKWIDIMADLGYNTLMLYTEDTFEVDNQPYFGYLRGRYSKEEIREIDEYAYEKGIELIPAIQTLAHLETIFRWQDYREINDCNDIILAGDDRTYKLIDDIFSTLENTYKTRTVNIGMDEAFMLGRGNYQSINGFKDRFEILLNHLNKVAEISAKHGFRCIMWGDMFFNFLGDYDTDNNSEIPEKIRDMIPENVDIVYWDYYSTDRKHYQDNIKKYSTIKDGIWFAGGLWSWMGFAPHNDYSIDATKSAFEACAEYNVKDVFLTMWGDNGAECSKLSLLPSLYYASEIAKGNFNLESIKIGFAEKFGISFDDFMLTDLTETANDNKNQHTNPEKYMLYNDCLMGIFDCTVREGDSLKYAECSAKLRKIENNSEYGYLFKTLRSLCDILAIKFDLGVRTRAAYNKKNNNSLKELIDDYNKLLVCIDKFYSSFREQWSRENKPQGFEVQDARIGGLYFRIRNCRDKIEDYVNGRINNIEELDEQLLDCFQRKPIEFNDWRKSVTVAPI